MAAEQRWPCKKIKNNTKGMKISEEMKYGVVVLTGKIEMVHKGHLYMYSLAKERLERAGYTILGGFACPSSADSDLGKSFRQKLAELATEDDPDVMVGTAQLESDKMLGYEEILNECHQAVCGQVSGFADNLRIFVAAGSEDETTFSSFMPAAKQGLVLVPRTAEDTLLEKPPCIIYVTPLGEDTLLGITDEKLKSGIKGGDAAYVLMSTPPKVSQFLTKPTPDALMNFGKDFDVLKAPPAGPWQCSKLLENLAAAPSDKLLAVLVGQGCMSPAHVGHAQMMHQAKERLEVANYAVIGGFLSPCNQQTAAQQAEEKSIPALSKDFRIRLTELSACDDPFLAASTWEAEDAAATKSPEDITAELKQSLPKLYPLSFAGRVLRVFYVCGSDQAAKVRTGIAAERDLGTVIVPRGDADNDVLEKPQQYIFVADAAGGDAGACTSAKVHSAIKEQDLKKSCALLKPAAARFMLAPTSSERQEFQADFDLLGITPSYGGLDAEDLGSQLKDKLKVWSGQSGMVHVDDFARLLRVLDPSWTDDQLTALLNKISTPDKPCIDSDAFIDYIFNA